VRRIVALEWELCARTIGLRIVADLSGVGSHDHPSGAGEQRRRHSEAERIGGLGLQPMSLTSAEFGKFIADQTDKWAKVIKFANIKPE
jgi:hypothetical protein